jgi:hypothetical protein
VKKPGLGFPFFAPKCFIVKEKAETGAGTQGETGKEEAENLRYLPLPLSYPSPAPVLSPFICYSESRKGSRKAGRRKEVLESFPVFFWGVPVDPLIPMVQKERDQSDA